ncbi:MAG: hypothetical protein JXM70_12980 [Pirellulales bacterium]|nr:hypothetical protein [Pirellulales bacterium]
MKWGFQWGKVGSGAVTFLLAGGITVALLLVTGRLFFWSAGIAVIGFFVGFSAESVDWL